MWPISTLQKLALLASNEKQGGVRCKAPESRREDLAIKGNKTNGGSYPKTVI